MAQEIWEVFSETISMRLALLKNWFETFFNQISLGSFFPVRKRKISLEYLTSPEIGARISNILCKITSIEGKELVTSKISNYSQW